MARGILCGQHVSFANTTKLPVPRVSRVTSSSPDIYVLILDGYGRADMLQSLFRFSNPLPAELESLGFQVASRAASNYVQTSQSLAAALNLDYLPRILSKSPASVPARHRYAASIAHNRAFRAFVDAGYQIRFYKSQYGLVQPPRGVGILQPWWPVTDVEFGLYGKSMAPRLYSKIGRSPWEPMALLHRSQLQWTLDQLAADTATSFTTPTVVFAHILMPHPPFVFGQDGAPMTYTDANIV